MNSSKAQLIIGLLVYGTKLHGTGLFLCFTEVHAKERTQMQRQRLLAGYDLFSAP